MEIKVELTNEQVDTLAKSLSDDLLTNLSPDAKETLQLEIIKSIFNSNYLIDRDAWRGDKLSIIGKAVVDNIVNVTINEIVKEVKATPEWEEAKKLVFDTMWKGLANQLANKIAGGLFISKDEIFHEVHNVIEPYMSSIYQRLNSLHN